MLRREGWRDNHKRIYRLYSEQGPSLRLKRARRNKSAQRRQPQPQGLYPNHVWGAWILSLMRCLTGDDCACWRLSTCTPANAWGAVWGRICVQQKWQKCWTAIALRRPLPQLLKTDNGSEFAGKMLDKWVYERGIRIDFSRPGTPTDNATVESFNGRLRQECLNENWFMSLEDARCKIEAWRIHCNQRRPHSALGWMTPSAFAEKSAGCQNMQPTWSRLFLITAGSYSVSGSLVNSNPLSRYKTERMGTPLFTPEFKEEVVRQITERGDSLTEVF